MVRRWVCGVVVVAVIFGALGWSAPAMAKQPSDYYDEEFWYAEIGAFLGGFVGLGGAFSGTWQGQWTWGMMRALGAGLGVFSAGEIYNVQGNVVMAFILPGILLTIHPAFGMLSIESLHLKIFASAGITFSLNGLLGMPYVPLMPAVLAVIGFNMGAKVKDTGQPASLPWRLDLPVLSLEW